MVTTSTQSVPEPRHRIELEPNCSLSPNAACLFVGSVSVLTIAVALVFTLLGFWPVLFFVSLEVALLVWAVRASRRDGEQREVIVVSDRMVVVERLGRTGSSRTVFPRHWSRVTLHGPQAASHPSRLTIESHGRACEVGRFLTEEERRGLAERLRLLVGKTSESPALTP